MVKKMNKKGIKSKMLIEREAKKPNQEFHYTDENLVKYCLGFLKFDDSDFVLDVGAGKNMVWYKNLNVQNKDWCETIDTINRHKKCYTFP